jgi:hypothetical protein
MYGGTVAEAVAYVLRMAASGPVNVVVEPYLDGGRVGVAPSAVYVSRVVYEAIRAEVSP